MKIISKNLKEGYVKVMPQVIEDLWAIDKVINSGDFVSGKSLRTFKTDSIRAKTEKKPVFIKIEVEKKEFSESANILRVTGKIVSGKPEEFVQVGSYHTLDIELLNQTKITKEWKRYELQILDDSVKAGSIPKLLILLIDRDEYLFCIVRQTRLDYLSSGSTHISGKDDLKLREKSKQDFVSNIYSYLKDLLVREKIENIILAGPGFIKEEFFSFIEKENKELSKKIKVFDSSSVSRSGVSELLKQGIVEKVIGESKVANEEHLITKFLELLSKEKPVAYGVNEVKKAVEYGAVDKLMILDELLRKDKSIEKILTDAEKKGAQVTIFESANEPGQKLKSIGGIASILRFAIS